MGVGDQYVAQTGPKRHPKIVCKTLRTSVERQGTISFHNSMIKSNKGVKKQQQKAQDEKNTKNKRKTESEGKMKTITPKEVRTGKKQNNDTYGPCTKLTK